MASVIQGEHWVSECDGVCIPPMTSTQQKLSKLLIARATNKEASGWGEAGEGHAKIRAEASHRGG